MFQTEAVEKIKTHILCSVPVLENRAVYEIMWKNIVEPDRRQLTIWRMRIACWITKAIDTHSEYVIVVFPRHQWLHERAPMLRCTSVASLTTSQTLVLASLPL
jgi:hypothetical protein